LLSPDNFAVDPASDSELEKYVAWCPEKRIEDCGQAKFNQFIDLLKNMSAIAVHMIQNDYFASSERVELSHVLSHMLGCTEYGALSTTAMEVGYFDLFEGKYCAYLKQDFPKTADQK
jgi:hypothetical protein